MEGVNLLKRAGPKFPTWMDSSKRKKKVPKKNWVSSSREGMRTGKTGGVWGGKKTIRER